MTGKSNPADVIRELRDRAFTVSAADLGVAPGAGHQQVFAVLMETGYPQAVVTLVTIADGTTSLYVSNGGGVIGAGEHQVVRDASEKLIALADRSVSDFQIATAYPPPAVGQVKIYARTFDGLRVVEAAENDLGEGRHQMSEVFYAMQDVITAIRKSTPNG